MIVMPEGYVSFAQFQNQLWPFSITSFSGADKPRMLYFRLTNVKMPAIAGILTFMSKKILS